MRPNAWSGSEAPSLQYVMIQESVPFWSRGQGWVKNANPDRDSRWTTRIIFLGSGHRNLFDLGFGMEKIRIRDKHPGYATLVFRCHLYLVPPHLESMAPLAIPLLLYGLKKEGELMLHIYVMRVQGPFWIRSYFLCWVLSSSVSDP